MYARAVWGWRQAGKQGGISCHRIGTHGECPVAWHDHVNRVGRANVISRPKVCSHAASRQPLEQTKTAKSTTLLHPHTCDVATAVGVTLLDPNGGFRSLAETKTAGFPSGLCAGA
jgi:hypothetical protein